MRHRLRNAGLTLARWAVSWRREIGAPELLTLLGFTLLGAGLWRLSAEAACIICGAVLLWWVLPPRPPFIESPQADRSRRTGS